MAIFLVSVYVVVVGGGGMFFESILNILWLLRIFVLVRMNLWLRYQRLLIHKKTAPVPADRLPVLYNRSLIIEWKRKACLFISPSFEYNRDMIRHENAKISSSHLHISSFISGKHMLLPTLYYLDVNRSIIIWILYFLLYWVLFSC